MMLMELSELAKIEKVVVFINCLKMKLFLNT